MNIPNILAKVVVDRAGLDYPSYHNNLGLANRPKAGMESRRVPKLLANLKTARHEGATSQPGLTTTRTERAMASSRLSEGWVYFIGSRPGEPVKIGHTNNLEKRLISIQNGNHRDMAILAAFLVPIAKDAECKLHTRFKDDRLRGEWFRWSKPIGTTVRAIQRKCPVTLGRLRCLGHIHINGWYARAEVAEIERAPW